jgi:hypothetical protein
MAEHHDALDQQMIDSRFDARCGGKQLQQQANSVDQIKTFRLLRVHYKDLRAFGEYINNAVNKCVTTKEQFTIYTKSHPMHPSVKLAIVPV